MAATAALHPEAAVPGENAIEQVEVVAGDPPVKVAAAALLNHPCVKLKTILPLVIGTFVWVVNARVKVPAAFAVAPGTRSAATEAAAVPLPLAVPPTVIAGTEPEAGVSMMAPPLVVVQAM